MASNTSGRTKLGIEIGATVDSKSLKETLRRLSGALGGDLANRIQKAMKLSTAGGVLTKALQQIFREAAQSSEKEISDLGVRLEKALDIVRKKGGLTGDKRQASLIKLFDLAEIKETERFLKSSQAEVKRLDKIIEDTAKTVNNKLLKNLKLTGKEFEKLAKDEHTSNQRKIKELRLIGREFEKNAKSESDAARASRKFRSDFDTATEENIRRTKAQSAATRKLASAQIAANKEQNAYSVALAKAEARIKASGTSLTKFDKILRKVNADLNTRLGLPQGRKNIDAINIATKQVTSSFGKWAKAGTRVLIAMGLLGTVRRITQDVTDLARGIGNLALKAAELRDAEVGFRRLASQTTNAELALVKIRAAAAGTVDDFTLLNNATKAALAGLAPERFNEIVLGARALAAVTGREVPDAIERMTGAITKQERRLLDELGIVVRAKDLFEDYAKAQGLVASQLTASQKAAAFFDGVLEKVNEKVRQLGGVVEEAQRPFLLLQESFRTLSLEIGEAIRKNEKFQSIMQQLIDFADKLSGKLQKPEQTISKLLAEVDALRVRAAIEKDSVIKSALFIEATNKEQQALKSLNIEIPKTAEEVSIVEVKIARLTKTLDKAAETGSAGFNFIDEFNLFREVPGKITQDLQHTGKLLTDIDQIPLSKILNRIQLLQVALKASSEGVEGLSQLKNIILGITPQTGKTAFEFLVLNKQQLEKTLKEQLTTIDLFAAKQKKSESDRLKERIQELKDFEELAVQFKVEGFDKTVQLLQEQRRLELALIKEKEDRDKLHTKFIEDEQKRRLAFLKGIKALEIKGEEDKFEKQRLATIKAHQDLAVRTEASGTRLGAINKSLGESLTQINKDEVLDKELTEEKKFQETLKGIARAEKAKEAEAKKELSRQQRLSKGLTALEIKAETDKFEKKRLAAIKQAKDLAISTKASGTELDKISFNLGKRLANIDKEQAVEKSKIEAKKFADTFSGIARAEAEQVRATEQLQRLLNRIDVKGGINRFDRQRTRLEKDKEQAIKFAKKAGVELTDIQLKIFDDRNSRISNEDIIFNKKKDISIAKSSLEIAKQSSSKFRELRLKQFRVEEDLIKEQVRQKVITEEEGFRQISILMDKFEQDTKKSLSTQVVLYANATKKIVRFFERIGVVSKDTANNFILAAEGIASFAKGLETGDISSIIGGILDLQRGIDNFVKTGIRAEIKRLKVYTTTLEIAKQRTVEAGRTMGQSLGTAITSGLEIDFDILVRQFVKANVAKSIADVASKKLGPLLRDMEKGIAARFLGPEDFNKQFEAELNARVATFKAASKGDFDKFVRDTFIDPAIIAEAQLKGVNEDNKFRIVASRLLQREGVKEDLNKVNLKLLDQVNDLTPGLKAITDTLGKAFGGITDANSRLDEAIPQVSFRAATEPQFDSHLLMMSQLLNFQAQISTNTGSIAGSTSEMANILRNNNGAVGGNFIPAVGGINQNQGLEAMNNVNNLNDAVMQQHGLEKQGLGGNVLVAQ